MFVPESVRTPDPTLTIPPVPEMTPAKVVDVESPLVSDPPVNASAPVPLEAIVATVSETPFNSNVAPSLTITSVVSARRPLPNNCNFPADTVVSPVNVFAPDNLSVAVPLLVTVPVPLMTPVNTQVSTPGVDPSSTSTLSPSSMSTN